MWAALATLLLFVSFNGISGAALADEARSAGCEVVQDDGLVECVDPLGAPLWSMTHPSLEDRRHGATGWAEIAGPLRQGARVIYGVHSDLLEVGEDPASGEFKVLSRARFPRSIEGFEVGQTGELDVLLKPLSVFVSEPKSPRTMSHKLGGPSPGQFRWDNDMQAIGWAISPAREEAQGLLRGEDAPADDEQKIQRLKEGAERDPTNPYYAYYIGKTLHKSGEKEAASEAFSGVIALEGAVWQDQLAVSGLLLKYDEFELSEALFERGMAGMKASGVSPERISGPLAIFWLLPELTDAIAEALARDEVERVDQLAERLIRLAPYSEELDQASAKLAAWMEAGGEAELAKKWRAHSARASEGVFNQLIGEAPGLDRFVLALQSAVWAGYLLMVLLGFYLGFRLLKQRGWLGRAGQYYSSAHNGLGVAALALLLIGALAASWVPSGLSGLARVTHSMLAPAGVYNDGWASPQVEEWVDQAPDGPAKERLLEAVHQAQRAAKSGDWDLKKEPLEAEIYQVLAALSEQPSEQAEQAQQGELEHLKPPILTYLLLLALGAALSAVACRLPPRWAKYLINLIPTRAGGLARGVVQALIFAAILWSATAALGVLIGRGHMLSRLIDPGLLSETMGLSQAVPSGGFLSEETLAWAVLISALGSWGALVIRASRRDPAPPQEQTS